MNHLVQIASLLEDWCIIDSPPTFSYGSGTHPWNRSSGIEQQTDDGIIEVIGLTTYQMVSCGYQEGLRS